MTEVTRILSAIDQGDPLAAEQLLPLVYDELRRLAADKLAREASGQTLDATALVHEAYLRLVVPTTPDAGKTADTSSPPRPRQCPHPCRQRPPQAGPEARRGLQRQRLDVVAAPEIELEVVALDEALQKLAEAAPIKARLVELRYFAGLTSEQAAKVLDISPSTADRHWAYARAWLRNEVRGR